MITNSEHWTVNSELRLEELQDLHYACHKSISGVSGKKSLVSEASCEVRSEVHEAVERATQFWLVDISPEKWMAWLVIAFASPIANLLFPKLSCNLFWTIASYIRPWNATDDHVSHLALFKLTEMHFVVLPSWTISRLKFAKVKE